MPGVKECRGCADGDTGSTNAITKGVTLSPAPTEEQRAELEALRALGATELDRTFLTRTIATHGERVARFARQAKDSRGRKFRTFAANSLAEVIAAATPRRSARAVSIR